MVFEIKQEKFEGPLDLLLTVIEKKQLHISDIALSRVTDDFLLYAKDRPDISIAESAEFAFIVSTLLLIKSRALLPQFAQSEEETESIDELERRLKLLQRFRELGRHVRRLFGRSPLYLPRERNREPIFAPPRSVSVATLLRAVKSIIAALPKAEALQRVVVGKAISIEQMIEKLKERVSSALRISFKEFAGALRGNRVQVIVGFLAMLELIKEGIITATQDAPHGNIMMETERVDVPHY